MKIYVCAECVYMCVCYESVYVCMCVSVCEYVNLMGHETNLLGKTCLTLDSGMNVSATANTSQRISDIFHRNTSMPDTRK